MLRQQSTEYQIDPSVSVSAFVEDVKRRPVLFYL